MKCEECQQLLEEYIDGELEMQTRRASERARKQLLGLLEGLRSAEARAGSLHALSARHRSNACAMGRRRSAHPSREGRATSGRACRFARATGRVVRHAAIQPRSGSRARVVGGRAYCCRDERDEFARITISLLLRILLLLRAAARTMQTRRLNRLRRSLMKSETSWPEQASQR